MFLIGVARPDIAVAGAQALSAVDSGAHAKFYDEHSLGPQRFYNVTCTVYGSDARRHAGLVPTALPKERAARCVDEFQKKNRGWKQMLAPHLKKNAKLARS